MKVYNNSRVYKIFNTEDPAQFYIGSTTQQLCKRMACHRNSSQKEQNQKRKLYQYANMTGWGNMKIELIEAIDKPMTLEELRKKEGEYIRELKPTLNKKLEGRTQEETKEIRASNIPCLICNKMINYTNMCHHVKSKKHIKNVEKQNQPN